MEDFRVICLWLQFGCEVIFAIFIRYVRAFPLIFLISASVSGLASLYSELRIGLTPQGQRGIIERSLRRYPERQSVLDMSTVNSIVQQSQQIISASPDQQCQKGEPICNGVGVADISVAKQQYNLTGDLECAVRAGMVSFIFPGVLCYLWLEENGVCF